MRGKVETKGFHRRVVALRHAGHRVYRVCAGVSALDGEPMSNARLVILARSWGLA